MSEPILSRGSHRLHRRWTGAVPWAALALLLTVGCSSAPSTDLAASPPPTGHRLAPIPHLERDLDEIREDGVLRVLMRNSPSGYHIVRGQEVGFEFELAQRLAQDLGVRLQVVLPDAEQTLQSQLNLGRADLVAAPFVDAGDLPPTVAYTAAYHTASPVLVVDKERAGRVRSVEDLDGMLVAVRRWSSEERLLHDLRDRGVAVRVILLSPRVSTEEILDMVADGSVPAAIAGRHLVRATQKVREELHVALELAEEKPLRWAVRVNSPHLLEATDAFLQRHRRDVDDRVVRSEFYNVLRKKYYSDTKLIRRRAGDPFRLARTGRISPYDDLFQDVGRTVGLDWRLLASLAYQESRFDPEQESWAGAVGLMQILPRTAGVGIVELLDPATNVQLGARHLRGLHDAYDYMEPHQRIRFALAAYNCGRGHLDDARALAVQAGDDPNHWDDVAEHLLRLSKPEVYRNTRYGYVRGTETVGYVRGIMRRYEAFREHMKPRPPFQTAVHSSPVSTPGTD